MRNKYIFVTALLLVLALLGVVFTRSYVKMEGKESEEELLVVTSFYPMYVAALNVVGDCRDVRVENLSEPQTGCLHDYQLTPQDMILLSEADVFVVNGGGIEGFLTEVAEAYPNLTIVNAGAEIFGEEADESETHSGHAEKTDDSHTEKTDDGHAEHEHGENAHAWMSIAHYKQQVTTICDELSARNPANKNNYDENTAKYLRKIDTLWQEVQELAVSAQGKSILIFHEAFAYLAEDYGMQVAGELNLDEERQVSAGEIADILKVIEEKNVRIILAEELYGKDIGDTIERETDCVVYYLDTLVRGDGAKDSWLRGMEKNVKILRKAVSADGMKDDKS